MITEIAGESWELHPLAAGYWKAQKTLVISDLHLGKAGHFRKMGYGVPTTVQNTNLVNLELLLRFFQPEKLVFLGDLFHSDYNTEWDLFAAFIKKYPQLQLILIEGNHDILHPEVYQKLNMKVVSEWIVGPYIFTHIPLEEPHPTRYNLSGHIHPGVRMSGRGKQSLRLPCFQFGSRAGLFPAFGELTGLHRIKPQKTDQIFVLAGAELVKVI
jgi:DNA ligase-associated metallophosphoesterase